MGDRSNIVVLDETDSSLGVVLYSHWGGHEIQQEAIDVLRSDLARGRWTDGPYLTRIIFQTLLERRGPVSETGFGISPGLCDNEYDILVIDPTTKRFAFRPETIGGRGAQEHIFARVKAPEGEPF